VSGEFFNIHLFHISKNTTRRIFRQNARKRNDRQFIFIYEQRAATRLPDERVKAEARLVERMCARAMKKHLMKAIKFSRRWFTASFWRACRAMKLADIVQEVFLSAYKNLHTLRDKNAVGAWLAMIARNRATNFTGRRNRPKNFRRIAAEKTIQKPKRERDFTAIRALPETYKETLVLRLVEGMTGQEIAERTGLTPESVRVNLHRGMKLLRKNSASRSKKMKEDYLVGQNRRRPGNRTTGKRAAVFRYQETEPPALPAKIIPFERKKKTAEFF
jgi:RNA polymerase sigma-70 factor (ECF subfamily)